MFASPFHGGSHDSPVAMDRKEPNGFVLANLVGGPLYRFPNVVELQVQEHFLAKRPQPRHDVHTLSRVKLHANLVEIRRRTNLVNQIQRLRRAVHVQGNNQWVRSTLHGSTSIGFVPHSFTRPITYASDRSSSSFFASSSLNAINNPPEVC